MLLSESRRALYQVETRIGQLYQASSCFTGGKVRYKWIGFSRVPDSIFVCRMEADKESYLMALKDQWMNLVDGLVSLFRIKDFIVLITKLGLDSQCLY